MTHLLKLLDKMYKYEMDPTRTVGAKERTRDAGQTNEWNQYTPQQLCCVEGINSEQCIRIYHNDQLLWKFEMYEKQ